MLNEPLLLEEREHFPHAGIARRIDKPLMDVARGRVSEAVDQLDDLTFALSEPRRRQTCHLDSSRTAPRRCEYIRTSRLGAVPREVNFGRAGARGCPDRLADPTMT